MTSDNSNNAQTSFTTSCVQLVFSQAQYLTFILFECLNAACPYNEANGQFAKISSLCSPHGSLRSKVCTFTHLTTQFPKAVFKRLILFLMGGKLHMTAIVHGSHKRAQDSQVLYKSSTHS